MSFHPARRGMIAVAFSVILATVSHATPPAASLDAIFSAFTATTPGCAVGVQQGADAPILRAYGTADLEQGVPNTSATIFEAGSASKQFTAAAILILAGEGRLALSDDIRKYLPEMPDYGTPITIAELLGHTSGLRDWGEVEDIAGWSRGERIYTLEDVLNIAAAQARLNYTPGSTWSYTNTGYNLAAIIVQRVSGQSLADFSRERIFGPLGMTHTSWRDDFRRIVPGRAVAYSSGDHGFVEDMPFENAYGNGGLLTTVDDLLIWNRAIENRSLGTSVSMELQRRSTLSDGTALDYARGLFIQSHGGLREVAHSGATAGYRAWLARYPEKGLSIALLCNDGDVNPVTLGHRVADLFLPAHFDPQPLLPVVEAKFAHLAGWYVNQSSDAVLHLKEANGRLLSDASATLRRASDGELRLGDHPLTITPNGDLTLGEAGAVVMYRKTTPFLPDRAMLTALVGRYRSDEADATYDLTMRGDELWMASEQRADLKNRLIPTFQQHFAFNDEIVGIVRDAFGRVAGLTMSSDRVWKLALRRVP